MQTEPKIDSGLTSTRERIREVALSVFAERGFDGTSTREVCSRAGVNGAALNYHWRSKEALWVAVNEQASSWFGTVVSQIDLSRPPAETIATFLRLVFDGLAKDPRPIRIVAWAALQPHSLDQGGVVRMFRPFVDFVNAYCRTQQDLGNMPKGVDTDVIICLVHSMLTYTLVNGRGLTATFGADATDPVVGARFREGIVQTALTMLGLSPAPGAEIPNKA